MSIKVLAYQCHYSTLMVIVIFSARNTVAHTTVICTAAFLTTERLLDTSEEVLKSAMATIKTQKTNPQQTV
jgi:hypothetical protein